MTDGEKKLHQTVAEGDVEALKRLVAENVDINVRDETWRWTPLHRAPEHGHAEIAVDFAQGKRPLSKAMIVRTIGQWRQEERLKSCRIVACKD